MPRDHADPVGEVAFARCASAAGTENQDALPDLDVVAGLENGLFDRQVVDEAAVGAADVHQPIAALHPTDLSVPARDFGVVEADGLAGVAADADYGTGQLDLLALVRTFDDD